jgi:hypothetical protein
MVIHDFDALCRIISPLETDAILIIDSDAVLAAAVTLQRFESVPRKTRQIAQRFCRMKPGQFKPRLFMEN